MVRRKYVLHISLPPSDDIALWHNIVCLFAIIEALILVFTSPHNLSHYKCCAEDVEIMMKLLLCNKLQYDV